jgi:hypothetical protein
MKISTLESLKDLHDNATSLPAATAARVRARKLAFALSVDVPEWAAQRIAPQGTHTKQPAPRAAPALAVEIPEALRAWRSAEPARCVAIGPDAVKLTTWIDAVRHEASYATIEMACAAVASGSIAWRRWAKPVLKSRFTRAA